MLRDDPTEATGLRVTHTSEVTEDQIDHLGHMNVRFYAVNAMAGTKAVLAGLAGWDDRPFVVHDTYTRHHREQMLGTALVVRSAVLGATPGGLRLHHELAAADTGVLAATFVHSLRPLDAAGRPLDVPDDVVAAAAAEAIPHPDHAATRTISLDTDVLASAPSHATVLERGLAIRKVRPVTAEECDDDGDYRVEMVAALTWGGESVGGLEPGDHLHETPSGQLMGWASMETRSVVGRLPRRGDLVQSFGAGVAVHDKVIHRVHWCFDVATGELVAAFEFVTMAFDRRARRPMSIPDGFRARELARAQPDLAPR